MADKPLQYFLPDIKLIMLLLLKDSENYAMEFYQVYFPGQKQQLLESPQRENFHLSGILTLCMHYNQCIYIV